MSRSWNFKRIERNVPTVWQFLNSLSLYLSALIECEAFAACFVEIKNGLDLILGGTR